MRRILAAILLTLGVTLAAPHAQMMQAITSDVHQGAAPPPGVNRQAMIPGQGWINETAVAQRMIPGAGWVNEGGN